MPAVTIVAAWIRAETGVGPAIASGNHVYNGICALLPVAPTNNNKVIAVISVFDNAFNDFSEITSVKDAVPVLLMSQKIAIRNPKSPIRFMINALLAAD